MKRYPKAELLPGTVPNRRKPVGAPGTERGTFHTLEVPVSRGWYDTGRTKDYYTFQYSGLGMGGTGKMLQVLNPEQISHALYHRSTDPQTNGAGRVNISIAFLGYARDIGLLNAEDFANLAEWMVWCETELGIEAEYKLPPRGSECYGEFSPCRMSWGVWQSFGGWCGHQNVPGQATGHWDPGAFDAPALHAAIDAIKNPPPVPPDPDPDPTPPEPDPEPEDTYMRQRVEGLILLDQSAHKDGHPCPLEQMGTAGVVGQPATWWHTMFDRPDDPLWSQFWVAVDVNTALNAAKAAAE